MFVRILPLLIVAACSAPQSDTTAPAPPAAAAPQPKLSQRCTNAEDGFSIAYPEGWRTHGCKAFHPEPFEVPRDSELPFEIAIVVDVEQVPLEQLTRTSQFERVLSATELTIGGRKAVRVEVEATGEGLADRGMRTLRYVVDLGEGRVLIASTHDRGSSHAANREILGRMIETATIG